MRRGREFHIRRIDTLLPRLREDARPFPPGHVIWDTVFDSEAAIEGRPTKLAGGRDMVILTLSVWLSRRYLAED